MPLTDTSIRTIKPRKKPIRLFDSGGLYLEIAPTGGKWWRFKYRFAGKEKRLSLGVYPVVPLAGRKGKSGQRIEGARDKRDQARQLLAQGIDPGVHRKALKSATVERAANSFEAVAREWYAKNSDAWVPAHRGRILRRFERDVFPWIGGRPVAEVTPPELLAVLRRIESRGAIETAHRALSNCGQVFRYAVATARAERDPSGDLRGALPSAKGEHFAAVTDPNRVAELLTAIDGYHGTLTVRCALRLAPLVFTRPGELRHARWADIDLASAEWRYIASKTDTPHIVPLCKQAVEILRELHPLTGNGVYVFPGARSPSRPMSDNAILSALRSVGVSKDSMSGHGFRAMARTILDEVLKVRPEYIEHQLGHAVKDPNGRAYNRTAFLSERRKMMQQWADYLGVLKAGSNVTPIKRAG
ncbi:MAG TPA: integrase arm-type DNA-binding domain-containing protein [Steroidobacteraceae bacterium]|nr:integrase arm-type DNA-binding domain-containing protein [Steroidobacteraceae bacterium]